MLEERVAVLGAAFARTLLPDGEQLGDLLAAGVPRSRVQALYPAAFKPEAGLFALPELIGESDLPAIQALLAKHRSEIYSTWGEAYQAAPERDSRRRIETLLREDGAEMLLKRADITLLTGRLTHSWADVQIFRYHQILVSNGRSKRARDVEALLRCTASFWPLMELVPRTDPERGERLLELFEALLNALKNDSASPQQLRVQHPGTR